jgi:iron(III) transport system substrate-binding protein
MIGSWWRALAVLPPLLLIVVPIVLREGAPAEAASRHATHLVIIGPNNETIRSEFAEAFTRYARRELHTEVAIDWRTPGGTSEIVKLIDEQFKAAFQAAHPELSARERKAFNDAALDRPGDQPEDVRTVRRDFLASDLGIGIDLMFGGGEFDHRVSLADKGYVVDVGLIASMPEVFREAVIPQRLGGDIIYDPKGRYVGTALASFGICYSPDRLALIPGCQPPRTWSDLGDPRLLSAVAMADPSKSGSIANCYVMMLQEQMAPCGAPGWRHCCQRDPCGPRPRLAGRLHADQAHRRANARYVTDSASRVAYDVSRGDACAGMCIDFYGRSEAAWTAHESGHARLVYVTPQGGTSITADPISCFRGAPHKRPGGGLHAFRALDRGSAAVGVPRRGGGWAASVRAPPLARTPRPMYTSEHRQHMSDAHEDPFALAAGLPFRAELDGPYFDLIRSTIKAVVLDPRQELVDAWRAIIVAGGPEQVPEAMAALSWMPYARHGGGCSQASARCGSRATASAPCAAGASKRRSITTRPGRLPRRTADACPGRHAPSSAGSR